MFFMRLISYSQTYYLYPEERHATQFQKLRTLLYVRLIPLKTVERLLGITYLTHQYRAALKGSSQVV